MPETKLTDRVVTPELEYAVQIATSLWWRLYRKEAPNWEPCDDVMGVLSQLDNMVANIDKVYIDKRARFEQLLNDADVRLMMATIGGCTCGTKTPEPAYHSQTCSYRLIREASESIAQIRVFLETECE